MEFDDPGFYADQDKLRGYKTGKMMWCWKCEQHVFPQRDGQLPRVMPNDLLHMEKTIEWLVGDQQEIYMQEQAYMCPICGEQINVVQERLGLHDAEAQKRTWGPWEPKISVSGKVEFSDNAADKMMGWPQHLVGSRIPWNFNKQDKVAATDEFMRDVEEGYFNVDIFMDLEQS